MCRMSATFPYFAAQVDSTPSGAVVRLEGELDVATCDELLSAVESVEEQDSIAIDLGGLTFIDSSGISAFLRCLQRVSDAGRRLVFTSPSPQVARTLRLVGVDTVLPMA